MQAASTDQLFLSDAQLEKGDAREAKAKADEKPDAANGYPITLPTKPLALQIIGDDAFVAENGFVCRRVDLRTGASKAVYKGHAGPVTTVVVHTFRHRSSGQRRAFLFTGSWDKTIKVWDVETRILLSSLTAHSDFIKSLHLLEPLNLLASGSTDRDVRLWSLEPITTEWDWSAIDAEHARRVQAAKDRRKAAHGTEAARVEADLDDLQLSNDPPKAEEASTSTAQSVPPPSPLFGPLPSLPALRSHTRPVEVLTSHAALSSSTANVESEDGDGPAAAPDASGAQVLLSADTMGSLKAWLIQPSSERGSPHPTATLAFSYRNHETGIYSIQIGSALSGSTSVQVWTASADRSVALSIVDLSYSALKEAQDPPTLLRIRHPDYVKCLLDVPVAISHLLRSSPHLLAGVSAVPDRPWLITGSTDEDVRVLDLAALGAEDLAPAGRRKVSEKVFDLTKTRSTGTEEESSNVLVGTLSGHWHEVGSLALWAPSPREPSPVQDAENAPAIRAGQIWLVSAALDGTLRRWDLLKVSKRFVEDRSKRKESLANGSVNESSVPGPKPSTAKANTMELTAEEEAELAELLGDD